MSPPSWRAWRHDDPREAVRDILDILDEREGVDGDEARDVIEEAMGVLGIDEATAEEDSRCQGRRPPAFVVRAFEGHAPEEAADDGLAFRMNEKLAAEIARRASGGMFCPFTPHHEGILPADTLLIHFSDAADAIQLEGICVGVPHLDVDLLGYTLERDPGTEAGFNYSACAGDHVSDAQSCLGTPIKKELGL